MRKLLILIAACVSSSPAVGQEREAEVQVLRAELRQAQEKIQKLEERLDALSPPAWRQTGPNIGPPSGTSQQASTSVPTVDLTTPARAQPEQAASSAPTKVEPGNAGWELAPPGPLDRPLAPTPAGTTAAVQLLAGSGSGRASFEIKHSKDRDIGPPSGGATTAISDTIGLTFSAPLSKDGDTTFATLDGLASGTKVQFGFTHYRGRIPTMASDDSDPLLKRARDRCTHEPKPYKPGCIRVDDAFLDRFMTPGERDAYERNYARRSLQKSFAFTLHGAVGYDQFAYFPLPALTKKTVDRLSFSGGGGLIFFPFDRTSASVDLTYERSFKGRQGVTTCLVPLPGSATITCVPGPLLPPKKTDKLLLAPEIRYLWTVADTGLIRDVGFAPRAEVDFLSGDVAIDMPIYLVSDEKSGLIGGARFGYLTRENDFKFGIFVGKAFSLFK